MKKLSPLKDTIIDTRSVILTTVEDIYNSIKRLGADVGATKELIDVHFNVQVPVELDLEEEAVSAFFGEKYYNRVEDEKYHYKFLEYNLLHKVKEVKYFHNQGLESRKFIIFSQDCISSIQYLVRGSKSWLIVNMRSSDVLGLLPLDLLALMRILRRLDMEYLDGTYAIEEEVSVTIGSCHYYLEGGRDNV